jgi:hypothetical protein
MSRPSRLVLGLPILVSSALLYAQAQPPVITATATADRVRFVAASPVVEIRVELFFPGGQPLFDSGWRKGNVLDWTFESAPPLPGAYSGLVTMKDAAGTESRRRATVSVGATPTPGEDTASSGRITATVVVHDGDAGSIVATEGSLTLRTGDVFAGTEKEGLRLTPEGKVGIGTTEPQTTLDVNGMIRTRDGVMFADGSVLTSASVGWTPRGMAGDPPAAVDGTGTVNQISKWVDPVTLGDSAISEVGGRLGVGTSAPNGHVHIFGPPAGDLFAGMGPDLIAGPAFNFGYSGASFGRSSGFFNVRPDPSAVSPNPSLRFMTANVERMIIANTGNVGIGTSLPDTKLRIVSSMIDGIRVSQSTSGRHAIRGVAPNGSVAITGIASDSIIDVTGQTAGVQGHTDIATGSGVVGSSSAGNGVRGTTSTGRAIEGQSFGTGLAGNFLGNVTISGTLVKGGGSFKIDHPLDPENKYLSHSFVESPDMMNVYNGNVTLDANGEAWVALPDWFEALNRDFRYQLTALGAPAPNLHVAAKVSSNRFRIAGGPSAGEVSWQITGIRRDAWANTHRIPVEEEKPASERGSYLHPKVVRPPR